MAPMYIILRALLANKRWLYNGQIETRPYSMFRDNATLTVEYLFLFVLLKYCKYCVSVHVINLCLCIIFHFPKTSIQKLHAYYMRLVIKGLEAGLQSSQRNTQDICALRKYLATSVGKRLSRERLIGWPASTNQRFAILPITPHDILNTWYWKLALLRLSVYLRLLWIAAFCDRKWPL